MITSSKAERNFRLLTFSGVGFPARTAAAKGKDPPESQVWRALDGPPVQEVPGQEVVGLSRFSVGGLRLALRS